MRRFEQTKVADDALGQTGLIVVRRCWLRGLQLQMRMTAERVQHGCRSASCAFLAPHAFESPAGIELDGIGRAGQRASGTSASASPAVG